MPWYIYLLLANSLMLYALFEYVRKNVPPR